MLKLESLRVFLNERLTAAAEEIFGAVEKTMVEYHDENERLRRLLRITPEITISRIDSLQFSLPVSEKEVPPEQQHCEQEWSPSLGQEDPEPTQIKEEQEELRTSQEEEQLQGLFDIKNSMLTYPCVKSEDPLWSLSLPQIQSLENRESNFQPVDVQPFDTMTHLKGLDIPCDPPDNHNNIFKIESDSSCGDCGKSFRLKAHVNSQEQTRTRERAFQCGSCEKNFIRKGDLTIHKLIHTGEKPFICSDCGKRFGKRQHLHGHKLTHTGERPFSCGDCGKCFGRNTHLTRHKRTHTGEKLLICSDCGKSFSRQEHLSRHILTHRR